MKWLAAVVVTVFLVSCAGVAPREYRQGIPVAPSAPPFFNPIMDAPITAGQPGYFGPADQLYPRSPYGRVPPETPDIHREPGR